MGAETRRIIPTSIAQHGISDGAASQHGDADCDDDHELSSVSQLKRDLPLYKFGSGARLHEGGRVLGR